MAKSNSSPINNQYSSETDKKIQDVKNESKKDNERVYMIMIGLVIFVVITFLIEIVVMNYDRIKDKDMYIQYTQMYKDYFDESSKMKEIINGQKIEINNLENKFELLKAKNSYLR